VRARGASCDAPDTRRDCPRAREGKRTLEAAQTSPAELIGRHLSGDWGTVDKDDWRANDRALREGTRLLSAYELPHTGEKVWVITEWDRSATTILLPSEY